MKLAFNNDPAQAERLRAQVLAHEAADEIIQGKYWEGGKGCFIGCIAHSDSAIDAASMFGGDLMLVRIAESIFEGLPNSEAKKFPARVLLAPRIGADLSLVPWKFLQWLVVNALALADEKTRKSCQPAVDVLAAKSRGEFVTADAAADAARAAYAAAADVARAADAAYAAADAARAAYAAADAADAARAAYAAARAAYAARAADTAYVAARAARAADAAADVARAADAARAAADADADAARAADAAAGVKQADKLVELLAAA